MTLQLLDAVEVQMASQLVQYIEQKRAAQFAQPPVGAVEVAADAPAVIVTNGPPAAPAPDGTIAVDVSSAPTADVPSDIEVAGAITEYAKTAGLDKAKALLEEFGAKRVMEVPVERRAELLARVRA